MGKRYFLQAHLINSLDLNLEIIKKKKKKKRGNYYRKEKVVQTRRATKEDFTVTEHGIRPLSFLRRRP